MAGKATDSTGGTGGSVSGKAGAGNAGSSGASDSKARTAANQIGSPTNKANPSFGGPQGGNQGTPAKKAPATVPAAKLTPAQIAARNKRIAARKAAAIAAAARAARIDAVSRGYGAFGGHTRTLPANQPAPSNYPARKSHSAPRPGISLGSTIYGNPRPSPTGAR